jgi:hypothetical protein
MKYFSKYRNEWIEFKATPTRGELLSLKKYHYRIQVDGVEVSIDELTK